MFKVGCRDVGVDCDYVVTGATFEEVQEKVFAHAGVTHAEMLKGLTGDEMAQLTKTVEANIKPV